MRQFARGLAWLVGVIVVLVIGLRLTLFKAWTIPDDPYLSASIAPTLSGGDTVLVLTRGKPGFGDLVRCPDPEEKTRWIVGRIVGVGGDSIDMEANNLLVNSTQYIGKSACAEAKQKVIHPGTSTEVEIKCDVVEMGGGWHYRGVGGGLKQPKIHVEVRTGTLYLLSDNRDLHDDSRDFGSVPEEACTERVVFRLWSKAGWSDDLRRMMYIH